MDGITFGRTSLLCTLLLLALHVCSGTVSVTTTPKVEVLNGESASLPCTFTVSSPNTNNLVEWYYDEQGTRKRVAFRMGAEEGKSDEGTHLSGRVTIGDDSSLVINPVQPADDLTFICQVTAGPAGVGDASTMLKVFYAPEKPELTLASSQAVSAGVLSEIATCTTMNGHPQPRIVWFKDNQPLPEVKDRKEDTYMVPSVVKEASGLITIGSTLYMHPTKKDKDSVFHCTVEYSMPGGQNRHKQSDNMSINLNYPSEIATFTLVNTEPIKEGDTVTMKCETDGNPQPEFEFSINGTELTGQEQMLTLKSVKRSDSGVYKCMAIDYDNLDADLSGEITLTVNYIDPMSISPQGPLSAKARDMVELQCKTKASKAHTVQWKKGSELLSQSGVLSLKEVTYADAGEYVCDGAVLSVPGLTAQASINLTVTGKPMIAPPDAGSVEKEGDMVTLTCIAEGYPVPQFTWKPSGKETVEVEANKAVSTVSLPASADVLKTGVICEATNDHGADSKTFSVSIKASARTIENGADRADKQQGGSSSVVIAVVICVLLLLLLVTLLYCLNKKGKLPCGGQSGKKDVTTGEVNNDIVVEMKSEKAHEEAGLLNKRPATDQ